MEKVDITIITAPVEVKFECPMCNADVEMRCDDFSSEMATEYCDWKGSTMVCPECYEEIKIDGIDWD